MASSRLLEEYQIKLDRYALLAAIAEKQFLDGWRPVAPLVLPVVLTTHGEFCPGAIELQEWLVEKYSTASASSSSRAPVRTARSPRTSQRAFGASCAHRCWSQ
jgi:hypothetical protein